MITTIFFDIGNVLLKFDGPSILRLVGRSLGKTPLEVTAFFWGSRLGARIERGEIHGEELFREFRAGLGFSGTYKQFERLWCEHFTLNRGTAALLKKLSGTHKVFLLSNTNHIHYDYFRRRYAFTRHVHGAVLSHEVRLRKPEPEIYRKALLMAGAKPWEAFFVDDLKENVETARKEGLSSLQYTGLPALKIELKRLGVLP
jgi:HAD superfamily hydrolase (TIGR01509 family)